MASYYAMISSESHNMETGVELPALKSQPLEESPEIASFKDKHRCTRFPCPICHPGRSQKTMLLQIFPDEVDSLPRRPDHGHGEQAAPVHISLGDGGHTCRRFPCPVCGRGQRSAGVQDFQ